MTVPGRPALFAAVVLNVVLLGVVVEPGVVYVVAAGDVLIVAACLASGRRLSRVPVTVRREGWQRFQLGREADFVFRIENRGRRTVVTTVRQTWPAAIEGRVDAVEVTVGPGEVVRAAVAATPRERGRVAIPPPTVDLRFPMGWARRRWSLPREAGVCVYPDLQSLVTYDVLRHHRALGLLGVHRLRMVGAGREFEELREYLPDDDFRHINWKATARRREPITNVYQAERSQDLLLCLDCGRMMGNPVGADTALDCAVDAAVMLAHVANRQGDRVGLALFREAVSLFLKPSSGARAVHRIIEELVDVAAEPVFPSYAALVEALRVGQKRRAMVFLFTDLNDPQLAADLAAVLPLVSRRYVVVVVSLRDPLLERVAAGPASERHDVYRVLAARRLADERDARSRDLVKHGVHVLDADAGELTLEVINRYLEIKTRQLL
ncbi:MAG: DUF58 domain-containing protein [Candidatus Brocadiia bacterium]